MKEKEPGLALLREPVKTVGSKDGTVQISVPKSWWPDEEDHTYGSTRLVLHGNQTNLTPVTLSIMQELLADASEGMNLEVWEKELDKEYESVDVQDVQTVEIDGVSAKERYIMRVHNNVTDYAMQAFLEKEGAFYLIEIAGLGASSSPKEELRKLMSTFKVLKPAEKEQFIEYQSETVVNNDQSMQIKVPLKWNKMRTQYDQVAEFILHDDRNAQLIVTRVFESKMTEGKEPEAIVNERFDSLQLVGHGEKTGWRNLTIDGRPAYQLEGRSELEGEKRGVLITGLKKGNAYYFLTVTCPPDDFVSHKREYKRIVDSFKVLKEVEEPNLSLGFIKEKTKVFKNKRASMKIELTEKWKEFKLFNDGEIEVRHDGSDNTLFTAYAEDATGLESVTMEDAYQLYIESLALENPSWTKPEPIKIKGNEAIYFKGTGIFNGRKAMVIMALTRSSRQFTQMMFTGEQDFMEANEDWFKKALTTYTETLD
ncbi:MULTISPECIES: PsbP-related protein [Paenibacillus]|uniref:PsbP-related protein n=1 Tax=Paenibacillus TaxID=44249 RepID=UPI002FE213AC